MSKQQHSVGNWVIKNLLLIPGIDTLIKSTVGFITQANILIFWPAAIWGGMNRPRPRGSTPGHTYALYAGDAVA